MSLACHPHLPLLAVGINGSKENVEQGKNRSCKIFDTTNSNIALTAELSASESKDITKYQKVTKYSKSGKYLASIFSDGKLSIWNTLDTKHLCLSHQFKDLQDVDFDAKEEHMAVAISSKILILSLKDNFSIIQTIDSPRLNKQTICNIRFARYATFRGHESLHAIVNTNTNNRSFVCTWKLLPGREYPLRNPKTKGIHRKSATCFAVSPKGDLLAFASNNLSLSLLDAYTFEVIIYALFTKGVCKLMFVF
ncbi:WD40-repeat-containing domain protein [Sporodiniella umbellata]|nr:WD40-repeat-containing domain protein [Sporodiniella umbellata]